MIGITDYYLVTAWNKRTIFKKMLPRSVDNFFLEVNLADHCNLNCQCCDHFSPIATPTFLDFNQYVKDIERFASLTNNKIGLMKLQGGEPLLNDRVIDYMKVTREYFSDSRICFFTDGLLLTKWGKYNDDRNIWKAVMKYEIEIRMTQYLIPLNLEAITKQAQEYDVPVTFNPPPESIVLRDGKIYTCPMIPYVHFFNKAFNQNLKVQEDCFIDIYRVNSYEEIAEFCTHRTSFCDYCAVHKRFAYPWKQSTHSINEWALPSS